MTRPLAVLRPEPGNAATATRIEALGRRAIRLPLFEVRALDWTPPDPHAFDALFLTSANAPRLAGAGLRALVDLPVYAVGAATQAAAQAAGLDVVHTGESTAAELLDAATARGIRRALFLAGRDHVLDAGGAIAQVIPVYASDERPIAPAEMDRLAGTVALLHSTRAARRFAELVGHDRRADIRIAAISTGVGEAAGDCWSAVAIAAAADDAALVATAAALAD